MGFIQICPAGSTVDCYVDSTASMLSTSLNVFSSSVVPLLLGALVLAFALTVGKFVIKKTRP